MAKKTDSSYGVASKKPRQYPPVIRTQAVEMFYSSRDDFKTRMDCAEHIANLLGVECAETVLGWVKKVEKTDITFRLL